MYCIVDTFLLRVGLFLEQSLQERLDALVGLSTGFKALAWLARVINHENVKVPANVDHAAL